jgi:adenine-specific DNA-methyltransferase
MGSKTTMLNGELGVLLAREARKSVRFIDLFAGSGAVSKYIATNVAIPTVSVDLLGFSSVLSGSITRRQKPENGSAIWSAWKTSAQRILNSSPLSVRAEEFALAIDRRSVLGARDFSASVEGPGLFILRDYGGHYFSPKQALILSAYHMSLPGQTKMRDIALAALIKTASACSASPGHTAQPFQPTERLLPHIGAAWRMDVEALLEKEVLAISREHAILAGATYVGDAGTYSKGSLRGGDLLFCDPPYSEAQYSRFYHVLEGIFRGGWPSVSGAGRAPEGLLRPSSKYSGKNSARDAIASLLEDAARANCSVVLTYPEGERSNGLSTTHLDEVSKRDFFVRRTRIRMSHSTLGGSTAHATKRSGAKKLDEIVYVLRPRTNSR